jgi:four helix bundle protein
MGKNCTTVDDRRAAGLSSPAMGRKGDDIAELFIQLSAGVTRLVRDLRDDANSRHLATQMFRAATGAGANYAEARGAESRVDFIHKLRLADKEVRETHYWLQLVSGVGYEVGEDVGSLMTIADRLIGILYRSIRTAEKRG